MFNDEQLAESAEHKSTAGEDRPDAIDYGRAWELHVEKIDNDRVALGGSQRPDRA